MFSLKHFIICLFSWWDERKYSLTCWELGGSQSQSQTSDALCRPAPQKSPSLAPVKTAHLIQWSSSMFTLYCKFLWNLDYFVMTEKCQNKPARPERKCVANRYCTQCVVANIWSCDDSSPFHHFRAELLNCDLVYFFSSLEFTVSTQIHQDVTSDPECRCLRPSQLCTVSQYPGAYFHSDADRVSVWSMRVRATAADPSKSGTAHLLFGQYCVTKTQDW